MMRFVSMRTLANLGLVAGGALCFTSAQARAQMRPTGQDPPQRGGQPKQETPYILVAAFRGDRKLGVQTSDEVRKRVASEHSAQELFVVVKRNIDATLTASGYKPDSALNAQDLMELCRQLHCEYVLDGSVSKTGAGVRLEPRIMLRTGQNTFTQPLPPVDAKAPGDAAKAVDRALSDALKGMKPYRDCVNDLRAQKWDAAAKNAQLGIQAYPNSSLARMCLLTALTSQKAAPDTIISVANAILTIDSANVLALSNLVSAYKAKGEMNKAVDKAMRLYGLDPTNRDLAIGTVGDVIRLDHDKALSIIDALLKDNPGDPEILDLRWKALLAAARFKDALAAGEDLVKADSSRATVEYFTRQIGAAQRDSNAAMVLQLAERAHQKFPRELSFATILAQSYLKAGQPQKALEVAWRASQIDPKSVGAWQLILAIQSQLNQPDSMLATAQKAFAAGVPKDSLGASLMAAAGPALSKAQRSRARADWEEALKAAQTVDAIAPTTQTKFYVGVSAFSIGADAVQNVQKMYNNGRPTPDDRPKICPEAKVAEENFAIAQVNVPLGGKQDPTAAAQIMGALGQYGEFVNSIKTALRCK